MDSYRTNFVPIYKKATGTCRCCRLITSIHCKACTEIFFNESLGVVSEDSSKILMAEADERFLLR